MIYPKICLKRNKTGDMLQSRLVCLSFLSINHAAGCSAAENCRSCAGFFFLNKVSLWEGAEV